ncbi:kinase-like domain-containing protein [Aspergillus floccosus]
MRGKQIGGQEYGGSKVVRISDRIVVKCGDIRRSEVAARKFAYDHADRTIVYIPEVYRFIESDTQTYLFMEHVEGQTLGDVDFETHTDIPIRIANTLAHLQQITVQSQIPGPIGGGEAYCYIFGDEGAGTTFDSVENMNAYMNRRLDAMNVYLSRQEGQRRFDHLHLTPCPLVSCHGGICQRNIVLEPDGSLCLVDWGFAGFYPRIFEFAAISYVVQNDAAFKDPITRELTTLLSLTDKEKQDIDRLRAVRSANLRCRERRTTTEDDKFISELYECQKRIEEEQEAVGIQSFITTEFLDGLLAQKSHPDMEERTTTDSALSTMERA